MSIETNEDSKIQMNIRVSKELRKELLIVAAMSDQRINSVVASAIEKEVEFLNNQFNK